VDQQERWNKLGVLEPMSTAGQYLSEDL